MTKESEGLPDPDLSSVVEQTREGAVLRVRVRPRAPRDAVLGPRGGALRVEVRAVPERGKANEATVRTVASWLRLPASAVSLASGGSARDKRILVPGVSASDLRRRIAGVGSAAPSGIS